jgi:uncharacterized membrane protein YhaH (DUF805 family)
MQWFSLALSRYADFSGRSRRAEYWFFALISTLILVVLSLVDYAMGWVYLVDGLENGVLRTIALFALLVPSLSVGARRLHDTGRSGWWQLLMLLPVVGFIVLVFFWVRDGQAGQNLYGNNPKLASGH